MPLNDFLNRLKADQRRGSKPRCHLLAHGSPAEVARRLTALADGQATIGPLDHWMPDGFERCAEAELHDSPRLLDEPTRTALRSWWLAFPDRNPKLPNWDIASTCLIEGRRGLLLVEAKAHVEELRFEERGKPLASNASEGSLKNHKQIGDAIAEAAAAFQKSTKLPWSISRDNRYQMSNRFAVACKLMELGYPVVLVYLGLLRADEMSDRGKPFATHDDWAGLVNAHSQALFPQEVWNNKWRVNGQVFWPLIRTIEQPLACDYTNDEPKLVGEVDAL